MWDAQGAYLMKLTSNAARPSVATAITCAAIPARRRSAAVGQARVAGQAAPPAISGGLWDVRTVR